MFDEPKISKLYTKLNKEECLNFKKSYLEK